MRIFISWSGERSRLIAEALRYWLPKVIQAVQPWMSANDIEKGTRWRVGISDELEQSSVGIICLTPENLDSSWIHFEAGALSKQQQNTYVCTLLYQIEPADVREPLAQFQTTKAHREDIKKLILTINNTLADRKLPDSEINESFDIWWPRLEQQLNSIPEPSDPPKPQREEREILEEILELARSLAAKQGGLVPKKQPLLDYIVKGEWLSPEDSRYVSEYFDIPPEQLEGRRFKRGHILKAITELKGAELAKLSVEHIHGKQRNILDIEGKEQLDENSNP
jgi:hypothetical protein